MSRVVNWSNASFAIFGLVGVATIAMIAVALLYVEGGCSENPLDETKKAAIAELVAVWDVGVKLSTGLAALGGALLLGLKTGPALTGPGRVLLAAAVLSFFNSAAYAIFWRYGLSELYLNGCPRHFMNLGLQIRFLAHYYFLMGGLVIIGLLTFSAAFPRLFQR